MPAEARLFPWLRRSVLGAWLAMAYALAVLALVLAPAPSVAFGLPGGIPLCSGASAPDDGSGAPASPLGELAHCKGCPHNPVLAGPPVLAATVAPRTEIALADAPGRSEGRLPALVTGLPPSRAPPAA